MEYRQVTDEERYQIATMRRMHMSNRAIAKAIGRHHSTVYREVERNASNDGKYRALFAGQMTRARRRHSRRNEQYDDQDFQPVEEQLREDHSPEQIVGRRTLLGMPVMSHETIYKRIWKDKERGGSLWRHLRCARKQKRKRYGRYDSRGRLAGKRMITERPEVVNRRLRIGDWEIDTVHGTTKVCMVTMVERRTGLVRIGRLPNWTSAETLTRAISLFRENFDTVHTITADNGSEFHNYKHMEDALSAIVYFATPHHAWERGTNENTNSLIRQYAPKRTNLNWLTQEDCDRIAESLNERPRKRLNYRTPNEVYYKYSPVAVQS